MSDLIIERQITRITIVEKPAITYQLQYFDFGCGKWAYFMVITPHSIHNGVPQMERKTFKTKKEREEFVGQQRFENLELRMRDVDVITSMKSRHAYPYNKY